MSNGALSNNAEWATSAAWKKSSYSNDVACIEVARLDDQRVGMRDSKSPEGGTLVLTSVQFKRLVDGIKEGELDHII